MTPTRWLIAAFWVIVIVMCGKSFFDSSHVESAETAKTEQHWYPPPLPGTPAAALPQSHDADVRQVSYIPKEDPQAAMFTAELTVKNFGLKKATNIQVRVQPYVGTDEGAKQPGPDEIMNPNAVDSMANNFQWVEFPDLGPGESSTKTLTFPVRTDAEPRESFAPKITFDTVKP